MMFVSYQFQHPFFLVLLAVIPALVWWRYFRQEGQLVQVPVVEEAVAIRAAIRGDEADLLVIADGPGGDAELAGERVGADPGHQHARAPRAGILVFAGLGVLQDGLVVFLEEPRAFGGRRVGTVLDRAGTGSTGASGVGSAGGS